MIRLARCLAAYRRPDYLLIQRPEDADIMPSRHPDLHSRFLLEEGNAIDKRIGKDGKL